MSPGIKVHGLDGSLVEPDWAPLEPGEVRATLRQYPGCEEPIRILSASPRPFSAASVVATQSRKVFVKRHSRDVRDHEGLLEEHRFIEHLITQGVTVPSLLATVSGETAVETDGWIYEVHETPPGLDLYGDAVSWTPFRSSKHACAAGRALARLHNAASGFQDPSRKPRPLIASFSIFAATDAEAAMGNYLNARPALAEDRATRQDCQLALELLAPFHADLKPSLPQLASVWTHNDLHASNLFWSDSSRNARPTAIIDFGLADRTNAVHDLAHAIERNTVEWLTLVRDPAHPEAVVVHFDHLRSLLEGYEQVRPLSHEEAAALAPLTALCHAEFALTEADYFLGVLHSAEKARIATDGYLVGHARWFHSANGCRLLDALHRWAERRNEPPQRVAR
jgi:Ser/Thr protein kinase RdoA (MazF antagonist)